MHGVLAVVFLAGYVAFVRWAIGRVYGVDFVPSFALALCFGIAGALRIMRPPISQLAVSSGRTGDPARANLWRAFALGPAVGAAFLGLPLAAMGAAAAVGEAMSLWRGWVLLQRSNVFEPDQSRSGEVA